MQSVLELVIRARDEARAQLEAVRQQLEGVRGAAEAARESFSRAADASAALAKGLLGASAALTGFGVAAVRAYGEMEQARIGFAALMGSAERAEAFLRSLYDFAATTPFEIQGLQDQARRLMALGFSAEQVIPLLRTLGDAVAAMGGSAEVLDRVVLAIAQIQAKGRVQAEEMLQLAEAGIPAWEILAQKIGVSIPEAMQMAEKGAIDAATAISALMEGLDQRFAGAMEAQSRTILGTWSNIKDTLYLTLADIGEALDEAFHVREGMQQILAWLQRLRQMVADGAIQRNLQEIGESLSLVAGALAGALTPGLIRATSAVAGFVARLSPWALAGTAVVAVLDSMGVSLGDLARSALDFGGRVVRSFSAIRDAVVASLTIALEKILAFFSSFRAAPAYAEGLFLALTAPIRGFIKQIESAAEAARRFFSGDWGGALEAARMVLPWNALGSAIEDAKRKFAEGTTIIRERWGEARATISVLEEDLANAMLRISQAWSGSWQAATKSADEARAAAEEARRAADTFAQGQERARTSVDTTAKATRDLTDVVDTLRKRYELGDLTLGQYLQSLRALLSKWEPHLQGLKAGTNEWKRYADAVLAARKAIEDATRSYSQMTRYEQERRAPRDFSDVMTGPEVVGVEGWRDAILDTIRLGSSAFGRLTDQIAALEARLARRGLSAQAEAELRAILEAAQRTAREWEGEILKALEGESEERLATARALGQSLGEEIAQGIEEGLTSTQLDIIAKIREELEAQRIDLRGALEADLAQLKAGLRLGDIAPGEYAARLRETIDTYRSVLEDFYRSGEVDAQAFNQLSDQLDRLQREWEELALTAQEAAPEWETSASGFLTFLQGITSEAEAALQTVRDLTYVMGPNELGEVIAANIAYLQELQAQVPPLTREYQILEDAIGELRVMYLELSPAVQTASDAIIQAAPDYIDVAGAAQMWTERLEELRQKLQDGSISTEEFARQAEEIRGIIQAVIGDWEAYLRVLEEQGVATDEAREALARLNEALTQTPSFLQAVQQERLDAWANDLTGAIATAANAITELFDAFSAQTIGGGISQFARGASGILSLIPGIGKGVVAAVGIIGDVLGSIVDGILSVFDNGMRRIQQTIEETADRFKLISGEAFQSAVESYQENYLFGLIRVTKYRIDKAMMESLQAIAGALEGGVLSGIRNAAKAFLRGAQDWANALKEGIRDAIENAVIEAIIQGAIIRGAIGKLLDQLTQALAAGDWGLASNIISQIAGAIPEVVARLEGILAPIRGALSGFGGEEAAATGVSAIRYELPSVTMASPSWVSEMGSHVAEFGAWVRELTERGVRVRVERESWSVLAAAIGG